MRILITNDDGISSESIRALAKWASKHGDVTVCAPKFEQSGKSHGIEIFKPFEIVRADIGDDIEAYSVDSTPADCVRYGIVGLGREYDLVLSGINRGYNIGKDIIYSGTVGAIFEAAAFGHKAIAISTGTSGSDAAISSLDRIFEYFKDNSLMEHHGLYNVNIPCNITGDIRITRRGEACYSDGFMHVGDNMFKQYGEFNYYDTNDLTLDTDCIMHGHISITPLTFERTDTVMFEKLHRALNNCNDSITEIKNA